MSRVVSTDHVGVPAEMSEQALNQQSRRDHDAAMEGPGGLWCDEPCFYCPSTTRRLMFWHGLSTRLWGKRKLPTSSSLMTAPCSRSARCSHRVRTSSCYGSNAIGESLPR